MGKGVEIFGGLFVLAFSVLLIPQMLSFAIGYKTVNELTSMLVEVIEVHEGLTESAQQQLRQWTEKYPEIEIQTQRQALGDYCSYEVIGKVKIEIALIGLNTELKASKTTKRVRT